jgi:hypothetical protein
MVTRLLHVVMLVLVFTVDKSKLYAFSQPEHFCYEYSVLPQFYAAATVAYQLLLQHRCASNTHRLQGEHQVTSAALVQAAVAW